MRARSSRSHGATTRIDSVSGMLNLFGQLLHTPRRTLLRRAVLQIHLWCGLALGLYTALIGLTGSVLVLRPQLEHLLRPQFYTLSRTPSSFGSTTLDDMVTKAEAKHTSYAPVGFEDLPRQPTSPPERPIVLYMSPRSASPQFAPASRTPDELLVYFDPRDGSLLGSRSRYAGPLGFAANLHYYLLAGPSGYVVNGVFALIFLVLCLSGWFIWWPGLRRMRAALHIHALSRARRSRISFRRLNWDIHTVGGFWANPLLITLVITGIYFVFPRPVLSVVVLGSHEGMEKISEWFSSPPISAARNQASAISMQRAWSAASMASPPDTPVQYLALPSADGEDYEAIAYHPHTAPYAQPLRIFIDQYTGEVSRTLDSRSLPILLRGSLYVYAIHFGSFAGAGSRVVWFLVGLTPTALFVSGVILWWKHQRP